VKSLARDNVCSIVAQSQQYRQDGLCNDAVQYVAKNLKELGPEIVAKLDAAALQLLLDVTDGRHWLGLDAYAFILRWCQADWNSEELQRDAHLATKLFARIQPFMEWAKLRVQILGDEPWSYKLLGGGEVKRAEDKEITSTCVFWTPLRNQTQLVFEGGRTNFEFLLISPSDFHKISSWKTLPVPHLWPCEIHLSGGDEPPQLYDKEKNEEEMPEFHGGSILQVKWTTETIQLNLRNGEWVKEWKREFSVPPGLVCMLELAADQSVVIGAGSFLS